MAIRQAVILAAGEGQRLRPFTATRPKSMLCLAGRPVLYYVIQALADNGIREVVVVAGYRKEQVYDYFGAGERYGINITYVTQEKQLGTAHALRVTAGKITGDFLVLPADNYIDEGTIAGFIDQPPAAVLVKRVSEPERYGVVEESDCVVRRIREKPETADSNLVNTGIYAFSPDIYQYLEQELDIPAAINTMITAGLPVRAVETTGTWLDIIYPRDIITLNGAVLRGIQASLGGTIESGVVIKGSVVIGQDTVIRAGTTITGPAVIGSGCEIGPQACILPATTIGDNVVVSPFSVIENCVIGTDVCIGPGSSLSHSVVGQGTSLKGRFTAIGEAPCASEEEGEGNRLATGVIMGEDCEVDINVSVEPDTVIGNGCRIRSSRHLSGNLPDRTIAY